MRLRTIAAVNVVDVQKRRNPSKHYVFIISVTYCDCTSQLLFRKYSQFFTLQMKLLDLFPVEGGQRDPKQRLIPFLPGKVHFGRSQIRDVANRRLKQLDNYCQALMRLPSHISQCEEVLEFFEPKPEDLSPLTEDSNSPKNIPGAEYGEAVGGDKYACVFVVAADYQQQENREVSLRAGERVEVIEKNDSGWWFVSTAEAQGWVPATYLISLREHHDDLRTPNADRHYVTVTAYSSSDKNDLAFEPGETVDVIQRSPGGWWFIRSGGKEGWAPAAYLRKVQDVVTPSDQAIAMETNRAPVFGQVEIIGNLMDISNLLNRKPANDTHILSNPHSSNNTKILSKTHSTNDIHTLSNINSTNDTLTHSGRNTDTLADMSPAEQPVSDPSIDSHSSIKSETTKNTHTPTHSNTHMSIDSNTHTSTDSSMHTEDIDEVSKSILDGTGSDTHLLRECEKCPNYSLHTHASAIDVEDPDTNVWASVLEGSTSASVTEPSVCCPSVSMPKAHPTPSIAWVSPQRFHSVENGSSAYSQKHPPRRENSLGFQLPQPPEPPCVPAEYYTIAEFHSCLTDGISFSGGQRAEVIEKNSGGWWYVQIGNKQGWAPCSYIDKRKTPSLNRRTSTLTRPKVPPPAPPIKKQTSLPCIESEIMTHEEERVYEEPEYDVPAVGLEFEFLPGDVKASDLSSLQSAIYRIDQDLQRQGRKDQYLYKNDMVGVITQNLETKHLQTQSPGGVCQRPVWDPPEYDAPTFEPHSPIEPPPTLQLQLEGSKLKPTIRPKPTNPDLNSLRRSLKPADQPNQNDCRIDSTSHMSNESDCATSVDNCMITCSSSTELSISTEAMPPQLYRSTAKFQQEAAGELSLPAGVLVEVLEKQTSGWWFVRWGSLEGWVPTYYLQPIIHTHTAGTHIGDSDSEQGRWACGEKNELCGQKMSGSNSNLNLQDSTRPLSGLSGVPVGPQEGKDNTAIAKIEASVTKDKNSVAKHYASVTKNKASVTKDYASSPSKWDTPLGTTWKNESLGMVTSLCSQTTHRVTTGTGRSVPVSMVKPKPHLIHNNLHEEYVSIADYHGDAESMAFPAGTRLEVLERSSNGWWYCRTLDTMPNHRGWVPSNFLEKKK
ncbi:SH3 and PX domain-containing protein 2A isoform X2 [Electrophorus electricus]|uniref:SH3 and PX domain-containing protein 2A isoform X2 n=1 Tax=Electrophorus electricus TaxID=8005 RepID=UPI0015D03181|nr:SH3 and PX domain-containing protein 2A isoform X2 [Electrophorus electricus]